MEDNFLNFFCLILLYNQILSYYHPGHIAMIQTNKKIFKKSIHFKVIVAFHDSIIITDQRCFLTQCSLRVQGLEKKSDVTGSATY